MIKSDIKTVEPHNLRQQPFSYSGRGGLIKKLKAQVTEICIFFITEKNQPYYAVTAC